MSIENLAPKPNPLGEMRTAAGRAWRRVQDAFFIPHRTVASVGEVKAEFNVPFPAAERQVAQLGEEEFLIRQILDVTSPQSVVLDIGAERGIHTTFISAKAARVFSVEPDEENRQLLNANIQLNRRTNVTILPFAIVDSDKEVHLKTSGVRGKAPRLAELVRTRQSDERKFQRIETLNGRSLDSLIEHGEMEIPDIMKIDIEGAEGYALDGGGKLLSGEYGKKPQHVFMEIHPSMLPEQYTPTGILQKMKEKGYEIARQWERNNESIYYFRAHS
jgi:FkbM family methyltransferase